jgi:hypothetical protein
MADTKTLSQFKSRLAGGGARSNLFEVAIPSFPSAVGDRVWRTGAGREASTFNFLCKTAQLPASTITDIPVPFRGRILKVAGDRTFDTWTVTVINDEDFQLRTAFETWMNTMSKLNDATGVTNPSSYMTDAYVTQLGRGRVANSTRNTGGQSSELRTYKFYDIFPTEVSAIDLSYENTDAIEEFTVTFQVQYFTIGNSTQANRAATGQTLIQ